MANGICDTGRTRLDYAINKPACRLSPSMQGAGNVESTAIGFVSNGASVTGALPTYLKRDKCAPVPLKSVEGPC